MSIWSRAQAFPPSFRRPPPLEAAQRLRGARRSSERSIAHDFEVARDERHPDQREGKEYLPAEPHQLVVAVARHGRLHPGEDEEEEQDLAEEPEDSGREE